MCISLLSFLFLFHYTLFKKKTLVTNHKMISELTNDWVIAYSLRNTVIKDLTKNVFFLAMAKINST